jgi:hypothetical protein
VTLAAASETPTPPAEADPRGHHRRDPGFATRGGSNVLSAVLDWLATPAWHRRLHNGIKCQDLAAVEQTAADYPQARLVANSVAAAWSLAGDHGRAQQLLTGVFASGQNPGTDAFAVAYLDFEIEVALAPGVAASVALSREGIGLVLAELHQQNNEPDAATDVLERCEPTTHVLAALAQSYLRAGRLDDVVVLTEGAANDDRASAVLCLARGSALHRQGQLFASRKALSQVTADAGHPVLRRRALAVRAESYAAGGKKAAARRDLKSILADASQLPQVMERLEQLGG